MSTSGEPASDPPPPNASPFKGMEFRHLLWAGLFMLAGISFLIYLGRERNSIVGQKMGELDLKPLLNAQSGVEESDLRGKHVLLHFWGPWCPPCIEEYPEIIKLQRKYEGSDDVVVISVSSGTELPENKERLLADTKEILKSDAEDLTVYFDPVMYSRIQVANTLGKKGFAYPTTVLLNRDFEVVNSWVGATRKGELALAIERQLNLSKSENRN
jgi:thiol-disulfide isomerase/thioredoxin